MRSAESLINIGKTYFSQGKYPEAEQAFRKAVEQKPDNAEAWKGLGTALGAQGKNVEAEQAFRKATD